MPDFSATWKQLLADLERERDELRLKIHLAKADGRDQLEKAERKLEQLRARAEVVKSTAKGSAGDVEQAAKALASEIKEGFAKVRRQL